MDVVCLGILVADIFSSPIDAVPREGELKLTDRFLLSAGGCAVNTAACLRKLGKEARVIGKVGRDLFGDFVVDDLQRLGIQSDGVQRSSRPTSSTFILNVEGEDRRYIHLLGANGDFSLSDVDMSLLDGVKAIYVGGYLSMPAFLPEQMASLFAEAKRRSVFTVLDVIMPTIQGSTNLIAGLESVLPFTDAFLPNEDEARLLTGHDDPFDQAGRLADLNEECAIIITRGRCGLLARRKGAVWTVGAPPVHSVDGSGAGDAFAAGFVAGLQERMPFEQALQLGSVVGASCTRALGCTDGVFTYDEARSFLTAHPLPVERIV